jgi:uncharacterized protein (TIGR01777 family)
MKIIIPGGTGQVGTLLARSFTADGHDVVVLSRKPAPAPWRVLPWDARTVGDWAAELDGADVVINLAGRSVNCRYTAANRREITQSRLDSTRAVGRAIANSSRPPRVWLQASTATIYAHRFDATNDEFTGEIGRTDDDSPDTWRFSTGVATGWEAAAEEVPTPHTRRVLVRAAMVMTPDRGGVFDVLLGLVRKRLGGRNGDGRQYVSWVHGDDFVRATYAVIENADLSGPVNVCSPHPLPNAEFMRDLRAAAGVKWGLPAAAWMIEVGAFVLRTESELILKSRRVVPGKLSQAGFAFRFPTWAEAAADLVRRWR